MAQIGLMLYTIRDECERDLEGTLRTVADLGYEGVELWQLHGHEPARVRAWLDELGLVAAGRHASLQALETELPALAAEVEVLGTNRVAISYVEPSRDLVARIAGVAEAARREGLSLGFHNHAPELAAAGRRRGDVPRPATRAARGAPLAGARSRLDLARGRRPGGRAREDERPLSTRPRQGLPQPGRARGRPGRRRRSRLRAGAARCRSGRCRVAAGRGRRGRGAAVRGGRALPQAVRRILEVA